ncbi:MAG: hypothetical protein DI629_01055 [Mesorhizobium amorphae]|nr:MAG: hypothetical protein DI629_01055 [Mesorhizobium amorphae]
MPNWSGSILVGRAGRLEELLGRNEAKRAGCYVLQGEELNHPMGVRAYIGRSDQLDDRVRQHVSRSWWNLAALISTSDSHFTSGHFMALESRMIQLTSEHRRAALANAVIPSIGAGRLGEAGQSDMENFLDKVQIILPTLGINLLTPSPANRPREEVAPFDAKDVLEINHRSGVKARAVIRDDEFIVLQGSLALLDSPYQHNAWAGLRQSLIDEGVLIPDASGQFLVFTRNQAFSSASAAAGVVLNRQASGPKEWKFPSLSMSLGTWRETATKYDAGAGQNEEDDE